MNLATTNIQPAFKNINGHLWSLMSMGLKTTGDYMKSLLYIEESLTFDEHETLYNFYKWILDGGEMEYAPGMKMPKRSIGHGNYNERYNEYLGSI